jgi:hypothetical protein
MEPKTWNRILRVRSSIPDDTFSLLSKYRARTAYLQSLTHGESEVLTKGTSEAYFVFLKLSLTYTAIELLHKATGSTNTFSIKYPQISVELTSGKFQKLTDQILKATPSKEREKVSGYIRSITDPSANLDEVNLQRFVALCRHLMFHGSFSPSGSGLSKSRRQRNLLLGLANASNEQADIFLDKWVQKRQLKLDRQRKPK